MRSAPARRWGPTCCELRVQTSPGQGPLPGIVGKHWLTRPGLYPLPGGPEGGSAGRCALILPARSTLRLLGAQTGGRGPLGPGLSRSRLETTFSMVRRMGPWSFGLSSRDHVRWNLGDLCWGWDSPATSPLGFPVRRGEREARPGNSRLRLGRRIEGEPQGGNVPLGGWGRALQGRVWTETRKKNPSALIASPSRGDGGACWSKV